MLHIDNITKTYGRVRALDCVSLDIARSGTTVLIGPSGCGKSTLLRTVIGLISQDSGRIFLKGDEITGENLLSLRREMGYVIQEGGLFPHLTAYGNVALMARYLGWNRDRISRRIAELVKLTKLPLSLMERYPLQLSGGQRQRVSLVRALMLNPGLLLLDEPLGALDPMIRADLQTDLKRVFRELKQTVLMVTHDMNEASFFGDTIVLMKDGSVVQRGTSEDLVNNPEDPFVTRFINAQMNTLTGMVQ